MILLSQSDLISLHKHAMQRFHMNVAVAFVSCRPKQDLTNTMKCFELSVFTLRLKKVLKSFEEASKIVLIIALTLTFMVILNLGIKVSFGSEVL